MPTYTYECQKCGNTMDLFHSMSASPKVKCEACGSTRVTRLLGTGAGVIFKGSGFYETDYKNAGKKSADTKAETKTETKTETKPKADSGSKETKKNGSKSTNAA